MTKTGRIMYRKTGKMILKDWVSYAPPDGMDRTVTNEPITDVQKVQPSGGEFHPAAEAQYAVAQYILKHYEEWKKGHEMPLDGTPLAAWNAITHEEAEVFKKHGIRTVEEIREMGDNLISRIPVPRLREKKAMAARFLEAADQNAVAADRQIDKERIQALEDQIKDMARERVTQAIPPPQTQTRGPGRPRKQVEEAA
jgi:hypothetical protein